MLTSVHDDFKPKVGDIQSRKKGVLIANGAGKANAYSCFNLQNRGMLFVKPGDEVYEGMIVGEHSKGNDLVVNVVRGKQLTNVRAAGNDENCILAPHKKFNLEQAIEYIEPDEWLEITPNFIRLRKQKLTAKERK